jgi:general secretion pathway protein G
MRWTRTSAGGYTFIELVIVTAIIAILASAALPIARVSIRRERESQLRYSLREMREAIDRFKDMADTQRIAATELRIGNNGYPASMQQLVDGVTLTGDASGTKFKFLRRVPIDPVTGEADWGLRSLQDAPDATTWGGQNVFDVYSKAPGTALDGTRYRDW